MLKSVKCWRGAAERCWKRDENEMKKKKPHAKSYQKINRALDAALAKRGEPKLTFRKGISASARSAEERRAR